MGRAWIVAAGVLGFGAVGMAAVGSHVLGDRLDARALHFVDLAVQMEAWHALALLGCGVWAAGGDGSRGGWAAQGAGALFLLGTLLFCGALYVLALTGMSLGPTAPAGGLCLMAGWLLLAVSGLKRPGTKRRGLAQP